MRMAMALQRGRDRSLGLKTPDTHLQQQQHAFPHQNILLSVSRPYLVVHFLTQITLRSNARE